MKTQKLRERNKKKKGEKKQQKENSFGRNRWKERNQNQKSPITECECVTNKGAQNVYYQNIDFIILHIPHTIPSNTNTHVAKGE